MGLSVINRLSSALGRREEKIGQHLHSCDVMNKENPGLDCIIIYGNTRIMKKGKSLICDFLSVLPKQSMC